MLAHDADHDVRSAAASALAQLDGDHVDETLEKARRERLRALVVDPGVVVPLGVLVGLDRATPSDKSVARELQSEIQAIAAQHPSRRLRDAAKAVLAALSS